jgi:hypothetical protein
VDQTIPLGLISAGVYQYQVPEAGEIIVKSLRADFNGAGIGSAWFPAVRIIAPGGVTDGEYPTADSVAAGGSATVDFFPGAEEPAAGATPASSSLPIGLAIDFSTTIASGVNNTMDFSDGFGTNDTSVFGTQTVGGKTYLQVKTAGYYRAMMGCQPEDAVDTGIITSTWFWNFGLGRVDQSALDVSQFDGGQFAFGGLNRWLIASDTFFAIDHPGSTAVTVKINGANLTGNLSSQQTVIALQRQGDYFNNIFPA